MALTKVKVSFVEGLTGAQLTGAMPAVDGSSLTGIPGMTKVTSNPAVNTNPSDGIGALWVNKSSGEMFVCKDATTDENIWINVGSGSGDIERNHQGTVSGYSAGSAPASTAIEKWSFTTDANATDVSDLTAIALACCGAQSSTHGYVSGGNPSGPVGSETIERFVFATGANAISVGTLTDKRSAIAGHSSFTHGYVSGGDNESTQSTNNGRNVIEKFAFASSGNGSDVGDLITVKTSVSGVMSLTHGYTRGGRSPLLGGRNNVIEKFPFASDTNSTDLGDLLAAGSNFGFNGQQSITHGYTTGGEGTGNGTRIQKHSFSSSANATSVGTLAVTNSTGAGASSTTHGYIGGGAGSNNIQKFSLSSDGNASNIADMTTTRNNNAGLSN